MLFLIKIIINEEVHSTFEKNNALFNKQLKLVSQASGLKN